MKEKGYYDLLLKLGETINEDYIVKNLNEEKNAINDIDKYLLKQFNNILSIKLQEYKTVDDKLKFLNQIIGIYSKQSQLSNNVLLQIGNDLQEKVSYHQEIRLIDNHLFTNENEQELINEINKEIKTADSVYFIYPFISKGIINKIRNSFLYAQQHNIKINFITTTFDDIALFVNLYELENLVNSYNNILIRVEDNTEKRSERIHIKAAIFKRKSGFSTAIVGSSNLTYKGMMRGREWNIKISEFSNPNLYYHLFREYEKIWNDNLVNFNNANEREMLLTRIDNNRLHIKAQSEGTITRKYSMYDFQQKIVNRLQYRRKINKTKHLIIMATGTGKTIISAFDYLNQIKENNNFRPRLLFLAHQREIIDQAILTFRNVLQDNKFGCVFYENQTLDKTNYLFATVQSVYRNLKKFLPDQFDVIIFDEAHHIAAKSFVTIFNYFQPKQVIGLTATPEREDNKLITPYFDNEFAYELRLWDAINQRLLSPFDYYCIDDISSNLEGIDLNNDVELFKKLNTSERNKLLFSVINNYIGIYAQPFCLVFCITITHAKIVANFLQKEGLQAAYLTNEVSQERTTIINNFKKGKINYLCVVNMFNEGIDVPQIDTIIMLRPTSSKTIYLQQLGRGLRKTDSKNKLEVYDLIANVDKKYDITVGIKNLYNSHLERNKAFLGGNSGLPYGCTITLEKRSQKVILANLQKWYENKKRIHLVIKHYYRIYGVDGLVKVLQDYELTLWEFYNFLNDFYLKIGQDIKVYANGINDSNRNKNLLKQFLFLNDYHLINYFYQRLLKNINNEAINYEYDNLLICSLLYEVTSMKAFLKVFPNYLAIDDLVAEFINHNKLVVNELVMILKYKLENETLLVNEHNFLLYPLLAYESIFTVRQALCAIRRVNFIKQLGELRIIAFQAGHLTFDQTKAVIFADVAGSKYGKKTKYDATSKEYWWSIPEDKTMQSKLVNDLQNLKIAKFLFLDNKINHNLPNLYLKLYNFIGLGKYIDYVQEDYITVKFLIE